MKSVIIHGEATQELDNAIKYYEKQKIGLGIDLLSEIEQALEKQPAPSTALALCVLCAFVVHPRQTVALFSLGKLPLCVLCVSVVHFSLGCGEIPTNWAEVIRELSVEQLEELGEALLDFEGLADLVSWLER